MSILYRLRNQHPPYVLKGNKSQKQACICMIESLQLLRHVTSSICGIYGWYHHMAFAKVVKATQFGIKDSPLLDTIRERSA